MASKGDKRKLAAILSADVVGYSRLMGADESGTLAQLKAHRKELIDPTIGDHDGRIVNTAGDSVLAEFASVVDAVQCAVAIQRVMPDRTAGVAGDRRIALRIGINLGDVIVEGDDIYGDGVNVAARLEGMAEPGGICISRSARDQVRDKLPINLEDLGEHEVKNISRPVRVFRVRIAEETPGVDAVGAQDVPDKPSIAFLSFVNMSGDTEQDYFADGIAEDIITGLSKVGSLFVIARNSSFAYKGANVNVTHVGRELGVRYVLEGSVRKAGERVRITAQLVKAESGHHLWAERYDRQLEDIFAVQDEVTERIIASNSGTGKTHIALGLGLAACQKGLSVGFLTAAALVHELMEARDEKRLLRLQKQLAKYHLLIIDELGFVPLSKTGAELLFEVFSQRYERGSILVTSNLPFDEWTEIFGSERLTGALLDRLTHHVHILEMNGESYRLNQRELYTILAIQQLQKARTDTLYLN